MLVPCSRDVSPSWAVGLANLLIFSFVTRGVRYTVNLHRGVPRLDLTRGALVKLGLADLAGVPREDVHKYSGPELAEMASSSGEKYLLLLDSDIIPPPNGAQMLMRWRLPVVSGLYAEKSGGINVHKRSGRGYESMTVEELRARRGYADAIGLGFCLVSAKVFAKLEEPWFLWDLDPTSPEGGIGEDFFFCERLREAKIPVAVDWRVRCLHVLGGGKALDPDGRLVDVL